MSATQSLFPANGYLGSGLLLFLLCVLFSSLLGFCLCCTSYLRAALILATVDAVVSGVEESHNKLLECLARLWFQPALEGLTTITYLISVCSVLLSGPSLTQSHISLYQAQA